jgi:hypothetical protein
VTTKSFPLSRPIQIGPLTVTSLNLDTFFQVGWLRGAPKTPVWFIGIVKSLFAGIDLAAPEAREATEAAVKNMLANFPAPSGEEVDEVIPWLLHIAERALGQPSAVVDQLGLGDMLNIVMQLLPGMLAIANFQTTSANGAAISPGSLDGAPRT